MLYGFRARGGDRRSVRTVPTRCLPLYPADPFARSRPLLRGILACALWLGTAGRVDAQAPEPLTKSEVLSLLATGVYSSQELADLLRQSCVTFDATERDREHVRRLGGDEQVLTALVSCRAGGGRAPAPPPAPAQDTSVTPPPEVDAGAIPGPQPPDAPAATARFQPSALTLTAGDTGSVTVDVSLSGRPLAGLEILLGGAGAPGGAALRGRTDARGRAGFTIAAGPAARLYQLPVRSVDGRLPERSGLLLEVVPGPVSHARFSPPELRIDAQVETTIRIRVAITDDFGNPVAGVRLELLDTVGDLVAAAVTDERGSAPLVFESAATGDGPMLLLFLGDRVLAELPVERVPGDR